VDFFKETASDSGIFVSIAGTSTVVQSVSGNWIAFRPSGDQDQFNSAGAWLKRISANGLETVLNYGSDGVLESVSGPFGHTLQFEYNNERTYISKVIDPAGREINYEYDTEPTAGAAPRNLTKVTYQDEKYRQYLYDKAGFPSHLTGVNDELGVRYATYDYDAKGRVVASEHAGEQGKVTLAYNEATMTTVVTDAAGNDETFEFTALESSPWKYGFQTPFNQFDSLAEAITAARSDCANCWNLQPSSAARYLQPSGAGGQPYRKMLESSLTGESYVYNATTSDPRRRVDSITDANGNRTKYGYDTYHRTTVTEADQDTSGFYKRTTTTTYLEQTSDLPDTVIAPSVAGNGNSKTVTTTYHSGTRRPASVTVSGYDPAQPSALLERTTTYPTYDSYAQAPTTIQGPRSGVADDIAVTYWDESTPGVACSSVGGGACGQLKTLTNAAGHEINFDEYYLDGRLKQVTDPNDVVTVYTYDLRGRLDTVTETPSTGSARVSDYDYDDAGQLIKVTEPNGRILNYKWTDAHLLDYVTDNSGNKVDVSHDTRGNPTGTALRWSGGAAAFVETLAYDPRNFIDTRQQGARPAADLNFDAAGRLEDETDSGGRSTDYDYDPLNRLKKIIDPVNGATSPTQYGYDVQDQLTSVQTPNGASTSYVHDDLGNLRKEVSPDRGTTLYGYDEAGNMSCRVDGRNSGSATTCETATNRWVYAYDALNRLTSIDYLETSDSPDVSFTHDTRPGAATTQYGRLRQVVAVKGSLTVTRKMDYDAWGNVAWSEQTISDGSTSKSYATSYEYDGNNQLKTITYPSGRVVNYTRRANGRIKDVKATFNGTTTTVVASANYYPFGPPSAIGYGNGMVQVRTLDTAYSPGYLELADATSYDGYDAQGYTVGNDGNITQITDDLNAAYTRDYAYDDLDRLTWDSKVSAANPSYTYDANGNRLTRTAGTYAAQSFSYMANSNRETNTSYDGMGNSSRNLETYDAAGRLDSVTEASGDTLNLAYNGVGELARTELTRPDACTNAVFTLAIDDFVFTPDGHALHVRTANTAAVSVDYIWLDDLPVAQFQDSYDTQGVYIGTEATYLHSDHLGTPRIGTNASKQITWRNRSDAFGIADLSGSAVVRLRFPGQLSLGVAGLNYNYYRDYDPKVGRYVESDPIGLDGGLNTYGYVGGNPLSFTDPLGLETLQCRKPLDALIHKFGSGAGQVAFRYGPFLYHQYSCVIRNGKVVCGGQDHAGSPLSSPGKPSSDVLNPQGGQCKVTEPDNDCFEKCLIDEWAKPRPRYGIPLGTDCQEYDEDVNTRCRNQCAIK
jgi:RHS repeat-associated protein